MLLEREKSNPDHGTTFLTHLPELYTVYPKKYAHGFCLAVLCGYTLTAFPISVRLTSLALWQSKDCPSASKATLMNMDKYFMWIHYERLHNNNKAKHTKTVSIYLGIYCICVSGLGQHWFAKWLVACWAQSQYLASADFFFLTGPSPTKSLVKFEFKNQISMHVNAFGKAVCDVAVIYSRRMGLKISVVVSFVHTFYDSPLQGGSITSNYCTIMGCTLNINLCNFT